MDEEVGVKATRLRRRLSVEADVQSPSTPSTPTKKRATRLVKPALELIDENVTEPVPKRATRKSISRDVAEPVEDKVVTPSRRSTRIRSNTSLVLETTQVAVIEPVGEKAVTPSRRSTRIRSNSSLVLETTQAVASSPRALRAARRKSQLANMHLDLDLQKKNVKPSKSNTFDDTETPVTPSRQTRRKGKDSTTSVDKSAETNVSDEIVAQVAKPITEIPEKEDIKIDESANMKSLTTRYTTMPETKLQDVKNKTLGDPLKQYVVNIEPTSNINDIAGASYGSKDSEKENLSLTSANLLNAIDTKPNIASGLNKTVEVIQEINNKKRKRTKSWTTMTVISTEDDTGHGKVIDKDKPLGQNQSGSGDVTSTNESININSPKKTTNSSFICNDSVNNGHDVKSPNVKNKTEDLLESRPNERININPPNKITNSSFTCNESVNNESVHDVKSPSERNKTEDLLESHPNENMKYMLIIEDSNSQTGTLTNSGQGDDQHVPTLQQSVLTTLPSKTNDKSDSFACEPMDIDETIPENVSFNYFSDKTNTSLQQEVKEQSINGSNNSPKKSNLISMSIQEQDKEFNERENKSGRKSLVSNSDVQNQEETKNENKSTFILSQLQDLFGSTNVPKKCANNTSHDLSKSVNINNLDKEADKNNVSHQYLTSTPLQKKKFQRLAIHVSNASIKDLSVESKNISKKMPEENAHSNTHKSDTTDDESNNRNELMDDEAEEASDDYESGDSRDDAERRYEEENEIRENGETLESDEDFSNESDYEKDSFIVSSDGEDNDLLSGSGEDLSLSDKELKMTAKSKKKFNERKLKEQKKASKEMFQARHKFNESDKIVNSKKSNRRRLDSSIESEKDDDVSKMENQIDANQNKILNDAEADESVCRKKKKTKRLSESLCENAVSENEITVCNESARNITDPLLLAVKQEPKTPQIDLSAIDIHDKIEEVKVDTNVSVMKLNEAEDPLHETFIHNENSNSSSDNKEIIQNYDSVLESLNKGNKQKKIKSMHTSLNSKAKKIKTSKEPIVDELNLTLTKKHGNESSKYKSIEVNTKDDEDISDSIDMQLLFPEDSNDSEVNDKHEEKNIFELKEDFIPLKRTEAKINVLESMEIDRPAHESELNTSENKSETRKSSLSFSGESTTKCNTSQHETELNIIRKKPKNRKSSLCVPEDITTNLETQESFLNVILEKKNKRKMSQSTVEDIPPSQGAASACFFIDTEGQQASSKKNNVSLPINTAQDDDLDGTSSDPLNGSNKNDKKKKKKNKNFFSNSDQDATNIFFQGEEDTSKLLNNETDMTSTDHLNDSNKSDKKKKKKNKNYFTNCDQDATNNFFQSEENTSKLLDNETEDKPKESSAEEPVKTKKKKNKKKNHDPTTSIEKTDEVTASNEKEKSAYTIEYGTENLDVQGAVGDIEDVSVNNNKKKNKKSRDIPLTVVFDNTAKSTEESPLEIQTVASNHSINSDVTSSYPLNGSNKSDKKKKKKNKHLFTNSDQDATNIVVLSEENTSNLLYNETEQRLSLKIIKKEKKNKKSNVIPQMAVTANDANDSDEGPMEVSTETASKNPSYNADPIPDESGSAKKKKNKKKKNKDNKISQKEKDLVQEEQASEVRPNKRKQAGFTSPVLNNAGEDNVASIHQKKKLKLTQKVEALNAVPDSHIDGIDVEVKRKKNKKFKNLDVAPNIGDGETLERKSKKRKAREDENEITEKKLFTHLHVPRLPESLLEKLDDKPPKKVKAKKVLDKLDDTPPKKLKAKKLKALATTSFDVIEVDGPIKPSNYLEESVHENAPPKKKLKSQHQKPKVLPFLPVAGSSCQGFTTNFRTIVLPEDMKFVAKDTDMPNFKNEYFASQRKHKLRNLENHKKRRNYNIAKF